MTVASVAKKTYDGLDFKFMEDYIRTLANADAIMAKYKSVKKMAKDCDTKTYPMTKKWFLDICLYIICLRYLGVMMI